MLLKQMSIQAVLSLKGGPGQALWLAYVFTCYCMNMSSLLTLMPNFLELFSSQTNYIMITFTDPLCNAAVETE